MLIDALKMNIAVLCPSYGDCMSAVLPSATAYNDSAACDYNPPAD